MTAYLKNSAPVVTDHGDTPHTRHIPDTPRTVDSVERVERVARADVEELCRVHLPLVHFEVRSISARLPGHVYTDDLISAGMAALAMA
ncbi:MAG TPA: hypothetical protein VES02_14080, partial [Dermatophilaceae bacterium]|nr:hypothetical protein [Dermatophilaceae bacterium]